jgi:tetratricopeptide (TPR) repeat protein
LKLGRLEEALKEAERSVSLDEKNVKGTFRVGLALHALKRYGEAVKALEKAQSLEKKKQNKDIENAIRMAEFMGRKQAAETSA